MQNRDVILAPQSGGFMATLREPIQTAKDRNQILGKPRRDVVKRPRHRDIATVHGRDITRLAVPRADGADARVAAASLSKLPPWLGGGTSAIRDEIAPMTRTSSLVRTTSIEKNPYGVAARARARRRPSRMTLRPSPPSLPQGSRPRGRPSTSTTSSRSAGCSRSRSR